MFSGSHLLGTNQSWCSDCTRAMPIIHEAMAKYADPKIHFVYVHVGDKPFWKNVNCPFKTDLRLRLTVIPTIMKWNSCKKLVGLQCEKLELLELLFQDEK